jgi:hypothetical protein
MTNTNTNYGQASDNTLFSLLIAAFIGWVAVSAVSTPLAASPVQSNVAQMVATHSNS